MADLDTDIAALQRDERRRSRIVGLVVGLVVIALGAAMIYFGATFEEPVRQSTRSVPFVAPIALAIGGVFVAFLGARIIFRGFFPLEQTEL